MDRTKFPPDPVVHPFGSHDAAPAIDNLRPALEQLVQLYGPDAVVDAVLTVVDGIDTPLHQAERAILRRAADLAPLVGPTELFTLASAVASVTYGTGAEA